MKGAIAICFLTLNLAACTSAQKNSNFASDQNMERVPASETSESANCYGETSIGHLALGGGSNLFDANVGSKISFKNARLNGSSIDPMPLNVESIIHAKVEPPKDGGYGMKIVGLSKILGSFVSSDKSNETGMFFCENFVRSN